MIKTADEFANRRYGKMKQLGLILVGGFILLTIILTGILYFLSEADVSQPAIVVPVDPTITYLEKTLTEQETAYQAQVLALEETRQQQQTDFESQIKKLNAQILAAQQSLDDLKSQEQELLQQIQALETTRAVQQATYQTNLQQTGSEYAGRQAQLQAQLDKVRAELADVNVQLGR
jgi:hypothetical protein